jgi:phage terminase large subunit GpA-like protein
VPLAGRKTKLGQGSLANIPEVSDAEKLTYLQNAFYRALAPPEYLTVWEWADLYRFLPRESSFEYGRWRTDRFPFLKRIMFCLSPQSRARTTVGQKGAQLGFTETMINWLFYIADHNPGPTAYIQGTLDAVKAFNSEKFVPAIAVTTKVAGSLGVDKPAELSDSALRKGFPGGVLAMGGANSDKFLRSRSVQNAAVDEEDTFKLSVGGVEHSQGSPLELLFKRLANFPLSKVFRASTPVLKETSTIEPAYLEGSQEQYYLPCPFCNPDADRYGSLFVLKWEHIIYSAEVDRNGDPVDVYCKCPFCSARIDEHYKEWMLPNGRWLSNKGTPDGELYEVGDVEHPSFQISALYSPYGFFSWRDAVREWLRYKRTGDKALLQVFVNQTLGETYSAAGMDISPNLLSTHCEVYSNPQTGEVVDVPYGGLVLTAGADVQRDRIEVETVAWGQYNESWSVDYVVLPGNPLFIGDNQLLDPVTRLPTVWGLLSEYLNRLWKHAGGCEMPVECALIDSKYLTEQVHIFCKLNEHRRIYPSKGVPGWTKAKGLISRPKRRHERFGTYHISVYPDEIKDTLYGYFVIDSPGPGYCHFPDKPIYNHRYFSGLTSENRKIKIVQGQPKMYWETPSGARNEPLDCRGLALAALRFYAPNLSQRDLGNPFNFRNPPRTRARKVSSGLG